MDLINKNILEYKANTYYERGAWKMFLYHNSKSEYVPLYCINKTTYLKNFGYGYNDSGKYTNAEPGQTKKLDTSKPLHLLLYNIIESNSFSSDKNKNALKKNYVEKVEKIFNADYNLNYLNVGWGNRKRIMNDYIYDAHKQLINVGTRRIGYINYIVNYMFLANLSTSKVLFTVVIKKQHLNEARILMLLGKEIPKKYLELWVRKDFINANENKYMFGIFKKQILTPCAADGIEIQIKDNFHDLFLALKLPVIKSLRDQKNFLEKKSSEFIKYHKGPLVPEENPEDNFKIESFMSDLLWKEVKKVTKAFINN